MRTLTKQRLVVAAMALGIAGAALADEDANIRTLAPRLAASSGRPGGADVRALVVDDHPLIWEAVSNILRRLEPQVDIRLAGD